MSARALALVVSLGSLVLTERGFSAECSDKMLFLRQHFSGPQSSKESNYFIDLWEKQTLRSMSEAAGLTNNHALFVNSHARGIKTASGKQHLFYAHDTLSPDPDMLFSIADFASLLGTNAARIHNVVLSACNSERSLSLAEVRQSFPNATNIIHAPAGEAGYQPMFFQMLLTESPNIDTLYEHCIRGPSGGKEYEITNRRGFGAKRLAPYIADLFQPGESRPFRTQIAGRELLLRSDAPSIAAVSSQGR